MTEPPQESPTDPEVSRLYRQQATAEPSAAIDQRILSAARAALAEQQTGAPPAVAHQPGWWQRWRTPLALATTVLLSLSLVLVGEQPPAPAPSASRPEQARTAKHTDDRGTVGRAAVGASPPADQPQAAAAPAAAAGPPAATAGANAALTGSSEGDRRQQADAAPASLANESALQAAPAAKLGSRRAPAAAVGAGAARDDEAPVDPSPTAERASGLAVPANANPDPRSEGQRAAAWLDEIAALRRAGRIDDAERELREFRRANPGYPLPKEFLR